MIPYSCWTIVTKTENGNLPIGSYVGLDSMGYAHFISAPQFMSENQAKRHVTRYPTEQGVELEAIEIEVRKK